MKEQIQNSDQQLVVAKENLPSKCTTLTGKFIYKSSKEESFDIRYKNDIIKSELRPSRTVEYGNVKVRAVNVDYALNHIDIKKSTISNLNGNELVIPNEQDTFIMERAVSVSSYAPQGFDSILEGRRSYGSKSISSRKGDTISWIDLCMTVNIDNTPDEFTKVAQQHNAAEQNLESFAQQTHDFLQADLANKYPILEAVQTVRELGDKKIHSVSDAILSRTYSIDAADTATFFANSIDRLISNTHTRDYVLFLALNIAKGALFPTVTTTSFSLNTLYYYYLATSGPLRFIDDIENSIATTSGDDGIAEEGGFYSNQHNIVVINNRADYAMAHEMTHASITIAFGSVNPYYQNPNDGPTEQDFAKVETEILKSISGIIGIDCSSFDQLKSNDIARKFFDDPKSVSNFLGINHNESKVIHSILTIAFDYGPEQFSAELPARMIDLYAQGVSADSIAIYFRPLQKYLQEHFSSKVGQLIAEHKEYCNQVIDEEITSESDNQEPLGNFEFCLAEALGY